MKAHMFLNLLMLDLYHSKLNHGNKDESVLYTNTLYTPHILPSVDCHSMA